MVFQRHHNVLSGLFLLLLQLCLCVTLIRAQAAINKKEIEDLALTFPPRPARIYTLAPKGIRVTTAEIKHKLPQIKGQCNPNYYIAEVNGTDYQQFAIDRCSGSITTARSVARESGEVFRIVVIAKSKTDSTGTPAEITITVTSYNEHPPVFTHNHYSQEILDIAPLGTFLMTLEAKDDDTDESNKELFYFVQDSANSVKNPWMRTESYPIAINVTTGRLEVASLLHNRASTLHYFAGAADGGSPQRSTIAKITLHIRNMSAPRDVEIIKTTESSILVCWRAPVYGQPEGYQITYTPRTDVKKQQKLVLSTAEILNMTTSLLPLIGIQKRENYQRTKEENKVFNPRKNFFCVNIDELQAFTLYSITIRGWASGNRLSMIKEPVTVITQKKDCTSYTCDQGVCQEQNAPPGFLCKCKSGYAGERCQYPDPCGRLDIKCIYGKCKWSANAKPSCECDSNYFGPRCQWFNMCTADNQCQNGGTCQPASDKRFSCDCPSMYTGPHCELLTAAVFPERDLSCPASKTFYEKSGIFLEWPETAAALEISLACPVSANAERRTSMIITRVCEKLNETTAAWTAPNSSRCIDNLPNQNQTVTELEQIEEEEKHVFALTSISSQPSFSAERLEEFVDKVSLVVKGKIRSKKVAQKVATAISNLLSSGDALSSGSSGYETSGRILKAIHQFTANVILRPGDEMKFREKNLVIAAKVLRKADIPAEVAFTPSVGESDNTEAEQTSSTEGEQNVWLRIPKNSLDELTDDNIRFQFVSFNDDNVFRGPNSGNPLNMPVISATVGNSDLSNLTTPISYAIPITNSQAGAQCVYWNVDDKVWSTEGLTTLHMEDGSLVCESTHLTAFSVLLDPIGVSYGDHSQALSIITYIGLALSTIALTITVATFVLFKALRRDRSGIIVMNLSMALLLLNMCFISVSVSQPSGVWCPIFGALLHYSVVAAFAWMLIEALNMHQLLVTVFPSVETHYMLKRIFAGWGSPLVLVIAACSWDASVYQNEELEFCVISAVTSPSVYYVTYFAPICIVLIVNCVVFVLVTHVLCQRRPASIKHKTSPHKHRKSPVTLAQLRGAVTVVALLGVTWIIGALSIGSFRVVFQYIFCLSTPLQGFIIFSVRVIQSAEARNAWYHFLNHGSIKHRHRGVPSSQRTHSSSQNNSSIQTETTGSTPSKSMFGSALKAARRFSLVNASGVFGAKNKLNPTKNPVQKRRSSTIMLHEKQNDEILAANSLYARLNSQSSHTNKEQAVTQDSNVPKDPPVEIQEDCDDILDYPQLESNLKRADSDLLLSISKLLPMNLTGDMDHCSLIRVHSQTYEATATPDTPGTTDQPPDWDLSKSVQPYTASDMSKDTAPKSQMLRCSSEMMVYMTNTSQAPSDNQRLSVSNNNLQDLKKSDKKSQLLNPD